MRIPQADTSAGLTLSSLRRDLASTPPATTISRVPTEPFGISATAQTDAYSYKSKLAALAVTLVESMFGMLQYGSIDSLEEYYTLLKERAVALGGKIEEHDQVILAHAILSSYVQSSLSLCQFYGWISNHGITDDDILTVLTHTCNILVYAAASEKICTDLLFIASAVTAHWKKDLADVNSARLYVIVLASDIIDVLNKFGHSVSGWGETCDLLMGSKKGCWCVDFFFSVEKSAPSEFKQLWQSVKEYTWDSSVDLFRDAKIKRRVCERARSVKIASILSTKEINKIATEQLHPILTNILNLCRTAMSSKENFILHKAEEVADSQIKPTIVPDSETKTLVFAMEAAITKTLATDYAQQVTENIRDRKRLEETLAEASQLREENERLKKECRAQRKCIQRLEEAKSDVTTSANTYTERDMLNARNKIAALEAEISSLHKYVTSATRQQEYINKLQTQLAEAEMKITTVLSEKQELQECYDELIAQQQVVEDMDTLPNNPLTEEELEKLRQIRVYGIAPDTSAMCKLCSLMPSSKIVLVGQNMSIHEDIPANFEMYFFVAALAGHKVYKKWRSRVKSMKVPYCHCNSAGLNLVARQILLEYDKQVLKT